jgi:hypothetical protein
MDDTYLNCRLSGSTTNARIFTTPDLRLMPQGIFEGKKVDNTRSSSPCNANAKIRPPENRYGTFYY